ncbi:MAG: T9SS type A sorting domain-containing protein [bacterium]|nr:T9SS type A sorting domain-containing protein [bacterium]
MIRRNVFSMFVLLSLSLALSAWAHWVTKDGWDDYATHAAGAPPVPARTDGMPDFDQKQDGWMNTFGQWNWCGPTAVGNCLWWFDSKFETIKCISLPLGSLQGPPAISDHYSLVHTLMTGFDDHDPVNVIPFITLLGGQVPGGISNAGITPPQMKQMIENYLALPQVDLHGHYTVRIIWMPTFMQIYQEVEVSQDVIVLVGFWQELTSGQWMRFGGHYMTVAGVDSQNAQQTISFSDPYNDGAETGRPGIVWNGWLIPHLFPPPHAANVHNDAGNVSHDYWSLTSSNSPGGVISPVEYGISYGPEFFENFIGQNTPDHLGQYMGTYSPSQPVHTELEAIIVICPNFDYGDLGQDYPTIDIMSCGPAHPLSDKAWLGDCINAEIQPSIYDLDGCDDGVDLVNLPWTPGDSESVRVLVTTGAHYAGEALYLNAWKDGNIDGDFDDDATTADIFCDEWMIQDAPVVPGWNPFTICDPGLIMLGQGPAYDLIVRFRLTSQPVGRYGYGGYWGGGNSNGLGTYDIDWILGEVEDYDSTEMQLAVELESFHAVPGNCFVTLEWVTASETDVDHFSLTRSLVDGPITEIARIACRGSDASGDRYSFRDEPLANNVTYIYRLSSVDAFGAVDRLAETEATPSLHALPANFALEQNFPNPFNASTEIRYALPTGGHVRINVYNAQGQLVKVLVDSYIGEGYHTVSFDASDVASGIYLYTIKSGEYTAARKMVLLR